jgi:hypothetical protein
MSLEPRVGWLLSYSYLWANDHRRGAEEGVKNRPCALIAATRRDGDRIVAIVLPVTHSMPADPETAIEIPALTKARLGLDAQRSWIICDEANVFAWPGPDLRAVGGRMPPSIWYGPLPPKLATAAREMLIGFAKAGRLRHVPRAAIRGRISASRSGEGASGASSR